MTINPSYWGLGLWKIMYSIAFDYPVENPTEEQKKAVNDFFESLRILLPCEDCRKHYNELLKTNPIENNLQNSESLKKYVNLLQNKVSEKESKTVYSLENITSEITKFVVVKDSEVIVKTPLVVVSVKDQPPVKNIKSKQPSFSVQKTTRPKSRAVSTPVKKGGCGCGKK